VTMALKPFVLMLLGLEVGGYSGCDNDRGGRYKGSVAAATGRLGARVPLSLSQTRHPPTGTSIVSLKRLLGTTDQLTSPLYFRMNNRML
jgi:hypothetical protein